ncbi:hypothetical protein COE03_30205, partial [Bacillus thuringiensis]
FRGHFKISVALLFMSGYKNITYRIMGFISKEMKKALCEVGKFGLQCLFHPSERKTMTVLLSFLLCAKIWFCIPIKMNTIKTEANATSSVVHINQKHKRVRYILYSAFGVKHFLFCFFNCVKNEYVCQCTRF